VRLIAIFNLNLSTGEHYLFSPSSSVYRLSEVAKLLFEPIESSYSFESD
jgi:hypothetical protein